MGLLGKIIVTVACILFSIYSFRLGQRKQEYESGVDTTELEKLFTTRVMGHFCGFMFLLPLVGCWFPKWANDHNWNLIYAGFLFLVLIFLVIPKLREDEEEMERNSNHHDAG